VAGCGVETLSSARRQRCGWPIASLPKVEVPTLKLRQFELQTTTAICSFQFWQMKAQLINPGERRRGGKTNKL
jgi:hypothetical protein